MTTIRQQRVAELLYEELSILIGHELDDPDLSLLTVTHVEISQDLRNAKVYVHHQNDEVTRRTVLRGLKRATPFMRRQIAQRVNLRAVPELLFYYDDTPERAARVDELLRRIAAEREANRHAAEAAGDVGTSDGSDPASAKDGE